MLATLPPALDKGLPKVAHSYLYLSQSYPNGCFLRMYFMDAKLGFFLYVFT